MIHKIHCSRAYHELAFEKIKAFCLLVKAGFFGNNPPFAILPLTEVDYETLITVYDAALTAYTNGGDAQHGAFLTAKTALMDATDLIAIAVDNVALGNDNIIILGGFTPTKANSEGVKPLQCIVTVKRGIAGELIPSCEKIDNARNYVCFVTEGAPMPEGGTIDANGRLVWTIDPLDPPVNPPFASLQIDFTIQRIKHFQNLKHDVTYYFYFFAVNATGTGPVSEVVSMVCW
jgi:hypothetical protein